MTDISKEAIAEAWEEFEGCARPSGSIGDMDIFDVDGMGDHAYTLHQIAVAQSAALSALPPRDVSMVEAAQVLADAMHLRQWPFYVVEMPLTDLGDGPAKVGFDAAKITYEVWDAVDFTTKTKHDNLPDAITAALNAIAQEKIND